MVLGYAHKVVQNRKWMRFGTTLQTAVEQIDVPIQLGDRKRAIQVMFVFWWKIEDVLFVLRIAERRRLEPLERAVFLGLNLVHKRVPRRLPLLLLFIIKDPGWRDKEFRSSPDCIPRSTNRISYAAIRRAAKIRRFQSDFLQRIQRREEAH
jgi:hypothetical protein